MLQPWCTSQLYLPGSPWISQLHPALDITTLHPEANMAHFENSSYLNVKEGIPYEECCGVCHGITSGCHVKPCTQVLAIFDASDLGW